MHVGVLAYHLAFDEHLTLGFNVRLADSCGMTSIEMLGEKGGRPIGMIGDVAPRSFADYRMTLQQIFGGLEQDYPFIGQITRVAVVGAMSELLVREAVERGANAYITGQFRQPARQAVIESGIGVLEIGHRRSEEWGLRALAGILRERWADLSVYVPSFQ
jgi:putative NIF3 family GTP cyclohydrolase 1 type 2